MAVVSHQILILFMMILRTALKIEYIFHPSKGVILVHSIPLFNWEWRRMPNSQYLNRKIKISVTRNFLNEFNLKYLMQISFFDIREFRLKYKLLILQFLEVVRKWRQAFLRSVYFFYAEKLMCCCHKIVYTLPRRVKICMTLY